MASYNPAAVQATTSASHPAPLSTMQVSSSTSSPQKSIAITQQHVQMNMQGVNVTVQSHSVAMRSEVSRTSLKGEASVVAASATGPLKNQALESPTRPALPPAQALPTGAQASGVPTNVGPPPASQHHPIVARTPSNTTQGAVVQQNMTSARDPAPLPANQHHGIAADTPSDTTQGRTQASTSSEQIYMSTNVSMNQQHANVQGVNVNSQRTTFRSEERYISIKTGETSTASDPGPLSKQRALPTADTPLAGEQVAHKSTYGALATSRAPITNGDHERGLVCQPRRPQNGSGETIVTSERTVEALKQVRQVNVHLSQAQVGDKQVGVLRAVVMEEDEIRSPHNLLRKRRFRLRVIEFMYIAASNEPENPEDQEETKKEKCIDCCFQSISCNLKNLLLCKRSEEGAPETLSAVKKIKEMSPILRRGRSKGWVIHTEMIFPLVKASCRNVWVFAELMAVVVSFILSMVTFSLGKNRIFNILHLALTIVGSILAIFDGVILLKGCCCFTVCKHKKEENSAELAEDMGSNETARNNKCCKECLDYGKNVFDLIRMIISELLFYPILICNIFEMITGETYFFFNNAVDGVSFVLFALSLASQLFFVYVVRIGIIIAASYHSQKERVPDKNNRDNCKEFDPSNSASARCFQCYFVFHICAQMVAQILMFIAIQ